MHHGRLGDALSRLRRTGHYFRPLAHTTEVAANGLDEAFLALRILVGHGIPLAEHDHRSRAALLYGSRDVAHLHVRAPVGAAQHLVAHHHLTSI